MDEEIYEKVKTFIYENDKLFKFLGAKITGIGKGFAKVEMVVREDHLNAANVCQGGVIFTLADLAFALASNSYGILTLAISSNIIYIKSAKLGDILEAIAKELHRGKKTALYNVEIRNSITNEKIAYFEGIGYIFENKSILKSDIFHGP